MTERECFVLDKFAHFFFNTRFTSLYLYYYNFCNFILLYILLLYKELNQLKECQTPDNLRIITSKNRN